MQQLLFLSTEVIVLCRAVLSFSRNTTQGDDCHIVVAHLLTGDLSLQLIRKFWNLKYVGVELTVLACPLFQIGSIAVGQGFIDMTTSIAQALNKRNCISPIDIARTCTACYQTVAGIAIERNIVHGCQRQCAIVLQQNSSFRSSLTCYLGMSFKIRMIAIVITDKALGTHHQVEHVTHTLIEILHIEFTTLHRIHNLLDILVHPRFNKVVASPDVSTTIGMSTAPHGIGTTKPICHHKAFVSPLITQDGCQQIVTFRGHDTIDTVIARHDSPRMGLFNAYLEVLKIELTSRTLTDTGIVAHTHCLLIVESKVLHRRADALTLNAIDIGSSYIAREHRVLGVILKVAATQRIALQTKSRS